MSPIIPFLIFNLIILCSGRQGSSSPQNLHLDYPGYRLQSRAGDEDAGCVTNDGRPGTCSVGCKTVDDTSSLPTCYSFMAVKFVCCPNSSNPPQAIKNVKGNANDVTRRLKTNLLVSGCGVRPEISAIVGGVDSMPNSWPWAAAIFQRSPRDPSKRQFICGGSILNEQYIVTAAHCVVRYEGKMKGEDFFVKVGGHDLRTSGDFYEVAEAIPHENYRTWRRYNDIALFKLAKKIDFSNPNVRPVCFPSEEMDKQDLTGQNSTVIGWGTTSFGGEVAKNLMEVSVPVVSNEECDKSYESVEGSAVSYPEGINHNFICSGAPEGGKDSCQGDSGGPLLYQADNVWYQIGVVSFGYKCAEKGYPGVYTRTSHFVKWLGSHVDDSRRKQRN